MSARKLMLVTGASSGIGAEFARQYSERGWDIALTARRGDRLEQVAAEIEEKYKVSTLIIVQDLARANSIDTILKQIHAADRHLDGIVNNAGYGLTDAFSNSKWKDVSAFMRVLMTAPIELTHKVLPGMLERGFGRIVNVASLAGYSPGTMGRSLYTPVKSALIKFSEAIHAEAQAAGKTNVHCTALCPGFTWSEFHDVTGTRAQADKLPEWMWMHAEDVVEAGIEAVERGHPVVVPGAVNKGMATLTKLLPEPIARAIVAKQATRLSKED